MRKKIFSLLFLSAAILPSLISSDLLAGSVRQQFEEAPPPPAGQVLVYLYRIKASFGSTPSIVVDGDSVTKLPDNSYTWFYTNPGSHSIRLDWGFMAGGLPEIESVAEFSPDRTYFVRLSGRSMAWFGGTTRSDVALGEVPREQALADLAGAKKYYPATIQSVGSGAPAAGLTKKSAEKVERSQFEQAPPPPPGYALVYVYRPDCPPELRAASIIVDGKEVAKLKNKAYTWFYLSSGSHDVGMNLGNARKGIPEKSVPLNAVAGESHYFRITAMLGSNVSFNQYQTSFDPVTQNLAEKELPRVKSYVPAAVQQVNQAGTP